MFKRNIILSITICLFITPSVLFAGASPDLGKGISLFDAKKYIEAQIFFENMNKKQPKNASVAYYLGKSFVASGENGKAVKFLEKAVKLDEKQADYHFVLGVAYSRYINDVGMFRKIGLARKMKNAMMTAVDRDEKHKDARVAVISFYLQAPSLFGGSLEEAIKHMEILKRQYPHKVFTVEGNIAEKNEKYEEAESLYRQTVEENRDPFNLLNLANYLARRKQADEAITLLKEYLTMDLSWRDTSKAITYYILGTIYEGKEMYGESEKALQSAKACNQEMWFDKRIEKKLKELKKRKNKI